MLIRYSENYASDAFFNKVIAKNVFFGGGLYINDGYLVNHRTARRYLENQNSLLRQMLSHGFARILTRCSDHEELIDLPERMADDIDSFRELVGTDAWRDFKPTWSRIAQASFFNGNARGWPRVNMSAAFTKLAKRVLEKKEQPEEIGLSLVTSDDLKKFEELFLETSPEESAARTKFENVGKAIFTEKELDAETFDKTMNELMTLGNQAYHYGFGMALQSDANENFGVTADTTIGAAFDEFLSTREVHEGQLDEVPLFWLPEDLSFENGEAFLKFIDPMTDVGIAKQDYLNSLVTLLTETGTGSTDRVKNLQETTTKYMNRIVELLGGKKDRIAIKEGFDRNFAMGLTTVDVDADTLPDAVAAGTPGIALALYTVATGESRSMLLDRFKMKDQTVKYNPKNAVTLGDIKPQIASLAFDPGKSKEFTSDLPVFD